MIKLVPVLILATLVMSGCVTVNEEGDQPTMHSKFDKGRKLPDADARVTVSSTTKSNNNIDIVVKHLVPPERINPRAHNYVVWEVFNGSESKPQSVGVLNLDKDFTGRLKTATPFRSFGLFITAEPKLALPAPTGEKLFWTAINH